MNNTSWLELLDSSNSCDAFNKLNQTPPEIKISSFEAHDDEDTRLIEIEIFDTENQKKFDKLTNNKKIKSPFKRRLENETTENLTEKKLKKNNNVREDDSEDENETRQSRKRFRSERTGSESSGSSTNVSSINKEFETDRQTLERRQKQIDYGKNTIGYDNYLKQVPKQSRTRDHPKTPPKHLKYSRRAWEGLIKSWRKKLHAYDPSNNDDEENDEGGEGAND